MQNSLVYKSIFVAILCAFSSFSVGSAQYCGSAKDVAVTSTPTVGLCTSSTASAVSFSNSLYSWSCTKVNAKLACSLPSSLGGGNIPDGVSITAYNSSCQTTSRSCSNGTLGGDTSYTSASCVCTPTAWTNLSACTTACPSRVQQVSNCGTTRAVDCPTNTYQYCAGCTFGWYGLDHGVTVAGYDSSCNPTTVSCFNGSLSPFGAKDSNECLVMPTCATNGSMACTYGTYEAGGGWGRGYFSCAANGWTAYCVGNPPCTQSMMEEGGQIGTSACSNICGVYDTYPDGGLRSWTCSWSEWGGQPYWDGVKWVFYDLYPDYQGPGYLESSEFFGCGNGICEDGQNDTAANMESAYQDSSSYCPEDCGTATVGSCGSTRNSCTAGTYGESSETSAYDNAWMCNGTDSVLCRLYPKCGSSYRTCAVGAVDLTCADVYSYQRCLDSGGWTCNVSDNGITYGYNPGIYTIGCGY